MPEEDTVVAPTTEETTEATDTVATDTTASADETVAAPEVEAEAAAE